MGHIEIIDVAVLDAVVVERLFFYIKKITNLPEYNQALETKRIEKQRAIEQVKTSIASIPIEQERLVAQIAKTESEAVQQMLLTEVEKLEKEQKQLASALPGLQKEHDEALQNLDMELLLLEQNWNEYPIEKRIALLNFLIESVTVDLMSPRWLRVRVQWLREEWGCEQMYMRRPNIGGRSWTQEEADFIKEHYEYSPREVLVSGLRHRTWQSIKNYAFSHLKLQRHIFDKHTDFLITNAVFCFNDMQFMEKEGLSTTITSTNWTTLSHER